LDRRAAGAHRLISASTSGRLRVSTEIRARVVLENADS